MNSFLAMHGIESWKPVITALLLPPVPLLLLTLIGARLLLPRRGLGWLVILVSVVLLWLSACTGAARTLSQLLLPAPAALSFDRARELRAEATNKKTLAIVILGAGVEPFAPEYGVSSLSDTSLERLRYGLWLAGQTGAPVAFSGGSGWAQTGSTTRSEVAGKIAAEEFGRPIRWLESESRDTRENAMPHDRAAPARRDQPHRPGHERLPHGAGGARLQRSGLGRIQIEPAPMGLARGNDLPTLDWLPSARGFRDTRQVLRELAGSFAGA